MVWVITLLQYRIWALLINGVGHYFAAIPNLHQSPSRITWHSGVPSAGVRGALGGVQIQGVCRHQFGCCQIDTLICFYVFLSASQPGSLYKSSVADNCMASINPPSGNPVQARRYRIRQKDAARPLRAKKKLPTVSAPSGTGCKQRTPYLCNAAAHTSHLWIVPLLAFIEHRSYHRTTLMHYRHSLQPACRCTAFHILLSTISLSPIKHAPHKE